MAQVGRYLHVDSLSLHVRCTLLIDRTHYREPQMCRNIKTLFNFEPAANEAAKARARAEKRFGAVA